jgi:hypothetical protein
MLMQGTPSGTAHLNFDSPPRPDMFVQAEVANVTRRASIALAGARYMA